jgi:hypothetical protein
MDRRNECGDDGEGLLLRRRLLAAVTRGRVRPVHVDRRNACGNPRFFQRVDPMTIRA